MIIGSTLTARVDRRGYCAKRLDCARSRCSADMTKEISCILADWGTTNLRGWAVDPFGEIVEARSGGRGLLSVVAHRFAESFAEFCSGWLDAQRQIPAI